MLFIVDKKAQRVEGMTVTKEGICFGEASTIKKDHIFACLHCEELRNITLIVLILKVCSMRKIIFLLNFVTKANLIN